MSIQTETHSPEHMRREKERWTQWVIATIALGIISLYLNIAISPLIYWATEHAFDQTAWLVTTDYFSKLGSPNFVAEAHSSLWKLHWKAGFATFGLSLLTALFVSAIFYAACPYLSYEMTHGDVRWATDKDIRRMERRRQIGIKGGYVGILGRWGAGQYIRLIEPISVACSAPPGTGKTAALVVPSIVTSDNVSMIVNDPKPELADMTSGYRSEIGYVFILDWSATDKPQQGIFYPRFNFLSSQLVPPPNTAERDTYLDAVAKVLIPDTGKGDKYFTDKGRDCLTGFMHYLVSHVNDHKNYNGIPSQWHGMEASFPMLVDWIADAQFQAGKKAEEANALAAANKQLPNADGMKMFLSGLADQIKAGGYSERAFTSIAPLIDMADKERSGVLGTMDQALLPFKNKAVKERTSACDFTPGDLRGMRDVETGEWLPVTLYICVNQAEAAAFANITALLYEVLSRDFLSYGPGETDKRGRKMGPMTICFMMDEFAKLPKSETVLTGPDLGRSKKVSYWLIFQARSQIVKTYSKEDGTTIDSTCGVTVLLSQNDAETAAHYQKAVGKTTVRKQSFSRNTGLSKTANPFAKNESIASEGVDFLRTEDITAMEPGTHLILPQNFLNRPLKVKSPFFFEDEEMLAKVFNPRTGKGPAPANALPEHIRQKRYEEWIEKVSKQQDVEASRQQKGLAELAVSGVQQSSPY